MSAGDLHVEVNDGDIIVTLPAAYFAAIYHKPADQPQLILKSRTDTDDSELLARAWKLANDKAREYGVDFWRGWGQHAPNDGAPDYWGGHRIR